MNPRLARLHPIAPSRWLHPIAPSRWPHLAPSRGLISHQTCRLSLLSVVSCLPQVPTAHPRTAPAGSLSSRQPIAPLRPSSVPRGQSLAAASVQPARPLAVPLRPSDIEWLYPTRTYTRQRPTAHEPVEDASLLSMTVRELLKIPPQVEAAPEAARPESEWTMSYSQVRECSRD